MVVLQPREDSGSVFSTTNNQEAEEGNHTPATSLFQAEQTQPSPPPSRALLPYCTGHSPSTTLKAMWPTGNRENEVVSLGLSGWIYECLLFLIILKAWAHSVHFIEDAPLFAEYWHRAFVALPLYKVSNDGNNLQFTQKLRNYLHDVKMEIKINLLKDLTIFFLEWLQNPELGWHVKNSETALSCTIPKLNIAVKQVILLARLRKQGEQQLCVWQTKYL